ncbi:MAG TPA: 2-hydroxyacyl-CoA dehydratase family protein [Anaeromyxobacteraceae bacterium]|nr:2-hydroxyacyl-CoA dehydratase family protein [Anaeromyxobacteraceae bacterium]
MILRRLRYEIAGRLAGPLLLRLDARRRRRAGRGRVRKPGPFGPPLECTRELKELMGLHYLRGRWADGAVPVAWVTSGFPVELLRPLGFHTVYPENHAALCGVQRLVPELSDAAEREGYSRDLCSYARADLGSVATGRTPAGRLPRPDLLACCTNICQTVLHWYRALAERFRVPLVVVDTPFVYGEAKPHHLAYVERQLGELVSVAEGVAGRRLDPGELGEVTRLAREGARLWGECLATARARPAPWTAFDGFFHMAPIVALRGTEACNAYYRTLLDELRDRVARGVGGIRDERHRLLWDNLPVWYAVREIATLLAERGFTFACASYTNAWAEAGAGVDPADPVGSAARAYVHVLLNQDLRNRLGVLRRLATEYGCDGAVLHSDRSCKPYSIGQVDLKERLARDLGIRVLLLEADHGDPRAWASAPGENRLAAFMEGFA